MRFDIVVRMTLEHHVALEAASIWEAQTLALQKIVDRPPEKAETQVEIEQGVR